MKVYLVTDEDFERLVYLVTDEDFERLRESLTVEKLKQENVSRDPETNPYRSFNFVVTRWYQAIQERQRL